MKKKLLTLFAAAALLIGSVLGVALYAGVDAEAAFDPETFDYDSMYIKDNLILWFDPFDIEDGTEVTENLPDKSEEGNYLTLGAYSAKDAPTFKYENGYLEISNGAKVTINDILTAPTEAGKSASYTVEYLFGNVDYGAPSHMVGSSTSYVSNSFPFSGYVTSYEIGPASFRLNYMESDNIALLASYANAYRLASENAAAQASYTFTPNLSHAQAIEGSDSDGKLDYAQTKQLIANYNGFYKFLTDDFTRVGASYIMKNTANLYTSWWADFDWWSSTAEMFRMEFGETRKLAFVYDVSTAANASNPSSLNYTVKMTAYRNFKTSTKTVTGTSAPADDITLAADIGTRIYGVRIYNTALSDAQLAYNHLVDVCRYYRLDPSFYTEATEIEQQVYRDALKKIVVGMTSKEEAQTIIDNALNSFLITKKNDYTSLYVQDGLLFMLNPMASDVRLQEGETVSMLQALDGTLYTVGTAAKPATWTGHGVNLGLSQALNLGDILPEEGNYSVHLMFSNSDAALPNSTCYGHYKTMSVGPTVYYSSWVHPSEDPTAPSGINRGWIHTVNGNTGEEKWKKDVDVTINSTRYPSLFTEQYGYFFEFINNVTITGNTIKSTILKGTNTVGSVSNDYGPKIPRYVIIGPNFNRDFYAAIVYDHTLSEEEYRQNHFANLMAYYRVDMSSFDTIVDPKVKIALYNALKDAVIGETTKEYLQGIVDNFAMTGGLLGVIKAEDYLTFEGIQSRVEDYASARALFSIDRAKLEELLAFDFSVEYGTLQMPVTEGYALEDLTAVRNEAIGEYITEVPGAEITTWYRSGETLKDAIVSPDGKKIYLNTMIDPLDYKTADASALNQQYYMRAYLAVDINGRNFVFYSDASSILFGDSISVSEAANYFLFSGYADSVVLSTLGGEFATLAAKAALSDFLVSNGAYVEANAASLLIASASRGAVEAMNLNKTSSAGIRIDMAPEDAMKVAPNVATTRAQATLYASIGLEKYETAVTQIDVAREYAVKVADIAYTAALEAGADEAMAEKIKADASEKLLTQIEAVETRLAGVDTYVADLKTVENYFASYTAENKLSKVFDARGNLTLNGTPISRYTIITDAEHLEAAESLQKLILSNFAISVGVYNIDNEYVGSHFDYTTKKSIIFGLSEEGLSGAKDNAYALYGEEGFLYLEGTDKEALECAALFLIKDICAGTGRLKITVDRDANAFYAKNYVPIVEFNYGHSYPAVTFDSYDAQGVWQIFLQKMAELPEEVTVLSAANISDYALSTSDTYYVATDGNDDNAGTIDAPLATVEAALDKIAYAGGGAIVLRGGIYQLTKPIRVSGAHSGTAISPTFITAYEGETVRFTSGVSLDGASFKTVDQAIADGLITSHEKDRLNQFTENNSKNVYVMPFPKSYYNYGGMLTSSLYIDGAESLIARWPNATAHDPKNGINEGRIKFTDKGLENDLKTDDVLYIGSVSSTSSELYSANKDNKGGWKICFDNTLYRDRILAYDPSASLYTYAAVYQEWHRASYAITLSVEGERNVMTSSSGSAWGCKENSGNDLYFYNVLEELDSKDEYLIDRTKELLYVYSESSLEGKEIIFSSNEATFMEIMGASHVVLDGLSFEKTLGTAINIRTSNAAVVQNCHFSDITGQSVSLSDCFNSGVMYCEFSNLGGSAIVITDPVSDLVATHNFIQNNTFNGSLKTQSIVGIGGVGAVVSHNLVIDGTLTFGQSFECIVEYNEFIRGSQTTHDSGPIYLGGAGHKRGNHVRYNLFYDLNYSRYGIYLDDLSSGNYIYGNLVEYEEDVSGGRCVNIHGGSMNVVYNNVCIGGKTSGILDSLNYYVESINGNKTGGGGMSNRWPGMRGGYSTNGINNLEEFTARFPLYVWYSGLIAEHMAQTSIRPDWDARNMRSGVDDLEIFLRSCPFNVYIDNVTIDCNGKNGKSIYDPQKNSYQENNLDFLNRADAGFADYENNDFTLKADSPIFEKNPNFDALPLDRMGLTK